MLDNDTDLSTGGDEFTADEAAAFAAMERGEEPGSAGAPEPSPAGGEGAQQAPAAAPAGEVAPGQVVDPEDENADDPEANKGRFVRHGAFHKERARRKELETEVSRLRDLHARGDERLRLLTDAMRAPQAQQQAAGQPQAPTAPPTPEDDIFGYAKHLEAKLARLEQGQQQMTDSRREEAEYNATVGTYQADIARFAQTEPAFVDAYRHLIDSRMQELAFGGVPQHEIKKAVEADELALVRASLAAGVSPAERVFQMARLRGFTPKAPESAPTAAPAAAPTESAAERAARVQAGQQAAGRSLSGAGGAPAAEMTMERLVEMSEAEFEAYAAKNPRALAALMGG